MRCFGSLKGRRSPSDAVTFLFIWLVTFAVFSGALDNGFLDWDDPDFIQGNPLIKSLSPAGVWQMAFSFYAAQWQPITWLSHALDYKLFGLNPAGHHFTSLLFHGVNAFLVFLLFRKIFSRTCPETREKFSLWLCGVAVGLLFALHPLRVESVAWISERKDILCGLFVLLTYLAYLRFVDSWGESRRRTWYALTLVCFVLALMSKPMAVTVPLVMLLLDVFPLKRFPGRRRWSVLLKEKVPFLVLSLACGVLTLMAQKASGAVVSLNTLGWDARVLNAVNSVGFYLEKTVLPLGLVPYYPYPQETGYGLLVLGVSVVLFLGITLLCVKAWSAGQRVWMVAWLYYLVTLAPVSGIIQVGTQAAADRYTYLPTLSFFFLGGAGLFRGIEKFDRSVGSFVRAGWVLGAGVILLLGTLTVHQVRLWKDSLVFWEYVAGVYPGRSPSIHGNLGNVYFQRGRHDQAEKEYRRALKVSPVYTNAYINLGLIYYATNRFDQAEAHYKAALKLDPGKATAHNNLGLLYDRRGWYDKAEEEYKTALKLSPYFFISHNNLGKIYFLKGKVEEAETEFHRALRINPEHVDSLLNLGLIDYQRGQLEEAEKRYLKALKLAPKNLAVYNSLGLLYNRRGWLKEADQVFRAALKINPNYSAARQNLEKLRPLGNR